MLGGGEFFGEGALAGQPARMATATAMTGSRIRVVPKAEMIRLLHQQHALSDRFIAHLLARNNRLEDDLVDQLFNACEKRLARTLLLLARYGKTNGSSPGLPPISQEVLAEMVGTTRSRVNLFMNKFRKLGIGLGRRRPRRRSGRAASAGHSQRHRLPRRSTTARGGLRSPQVSRRTRRGGSRGGVASRRTLPTIERHQVSSA